MARRVWLWMAVLLIGLSTASPSWAAKYAAIVMEADTGKVLFARNADARRFPASLTKMMTLYMAFDALDAGKLRMDQRLPISRRAEGQPPSKLGLRRGQTITVRDAIMALITKSANDAATVLAEAMADSEWDFAVAMTAKARALGMRSTRFMNASGLPNRQQVSTARDMARLSLALIENHPRYYGLFNTTSFRYRGVTHRNHNRLLGRYTGADGIKTGYIRASGFNLAASVERNGKRLIGVVFGGRTGQSRDAHMRKIMDQSFRRAGPVVRTAGIPDVRPIPRPNRDGAPTAVASAPSAAAPAQRPAETGSTTPSPTRSLSTQWGIQVGAFQSRAAAVAQIDRAVVALPDVLSESQRVVQPIDRSGTQLFRARLAGFDQSGAVRACGALIARSINCVTVPPSRLNLAVSAVEQAVRSN